MRSPNPVPTAASPLDHEKEDYEISTDPSRLDLDFITQSLNTTYWAKSRTREVIEASVRNSLCFGLYEKKSGRQVGFARVVTDRATFSWIADVFVEPAQRKKGLGKWLVARVMSHSSVANGVSMLATQDAHGLYEKFGFRRTEMMKRVPGLGSP